MISKNYNYNTLDYQHRLVHNTKQAQDKNNNLNLVNYLTWKNFGNIYPAAGDDSVTSELMSPTRLTNMQNMEEKEKIKREKEEQ